MPYRGHRASRSAQSCLLQRTECKHAWHSPRLQAQRIDVHKDRMSRPTPSADTWASPARARASVTSDGGSSSRACCHRAQPLRPPYVDSVRVVASDCASLLQARRCHRMDGAAAHRGGCTGRQGAHGLDLSSPSTAGSGGSVLRFVVGRSAHGSDERHVLGICEQRGRAEFEPTLVASGAPRNA